MRYLITPVLKMCPIVIVPSDRRVYHHRDFLLHPTKQAARIAGFINCYQGVIFWAKKKDGQR